MTKILLSGVPGTGKSTVATYIHQQYGFYHLDMEQDNFAPRQSLAHDRERFLRELDVHDDVILSWGFGPFQDRASITYLRDHGFAVIWLDGDRVASFREFMKREHDDPVMEATYYGHMQMIVATEIIQLPGLRLVNPFTEAGVFRPITEVAQDVIKAAA